MYRLKNFFIRLFQGRYGIDNLNRMILYLYIALAVVNIFFRSHVIYSFQIIAGVIFVLRFFSGNIYARQQENEKYLSFIGKITKQHNINKNRWEKRKTHIYRKCPFCKVSVRLPRKKGKHICTCPSCKKDFKVTCRF